MNVHQVFKSHFSALLSLFLCLFFVFFCFDIVPGFALGQEEAGVQVISNQKSPRPPDGKRKRVLFKEDLTIGVVEGDENYMFGEGIIFNTDDEGNFYITDWERRRIQKYNPAYSRFALMENGWLAVVVESVENEFTLFDLFDRDGNFIGHFKADIPADSLFFKNGKAYAVATKDDYKFAKRYAIEIVDEGRR